MDTEKIYKEFNSINTCMEIVNRGVKIIAEEINRYQIEQEKKDVEPDYSSWIGKPVWMTDDTNKKPVMYYFKEYAEEEAYPFKGSMAIDPLEDNGGYRFCRLIRDFEDLQRGEW